MIPKIRNGAKYTVTIPEFSGGINMRDGISLIQDNQLTDCKNMWYKDGMLRTRPRILSNNNISRVDIISSSEGFDFHIADLKFANIDPNNVTVINGKKYVLRTVGIHFEDDEISYCTCKVKLQYINENNIADVVDVGEITIDHFHGDAKSLLVFQHNDDIYCFFGYNTTANIVRIKKIEEGRYGEPEYLSDEDMYAPLVYSHSKMSGPLIDIDGNGDVVYSDYGFLSTQIEGFNLLGSYYKMVYSTVNKNLISNDIKKIPMEYTIPLELTKKMSGKKIKAKITYPEGVIAEHEITLMDNGQGCEKTKNETDGLLMNAKGSHVWFEEAFNEEYNATKYLTVDDFIEDNLELTLPCENTAENEKKVTNMTKAVWFGGVSYGIHGGSRLFLGGNTEDGEKALIVWSDLNNPLYFSENNYTYVGDKSQAVTAFGRQSDSLVIFKERELFQTQYISSNTPTAEELINQSVIDLSTQLAYFPVTQIHGYIGCDCPETVQLCRNRLVWACSNGKVYTLVSQNQYNERAVFEVSAMVERRLCKESFKNAHSADYDGYYIIVADNHVYVMDYNSYGYTYVSSHSKTEDANVRTPWYYWELPIRPDTVTSVGSTLLMPVCFRGGTEDRGEVAVNMFYIDGIYGADVINLLDYNNGWQFKSEDINIESCAKTKLFDFGLPAKLKSVSQVNIVFGNNNGIPITINFVSEQQIQDGHHIIINGAATEKFSPEHMHSCRLFPYTKGIVRFGVSIESHGDLAIDTMSFDYKVLGGAK